MGTQSQMGLRSDAFMHQAMTAGCSRFPAWGNMFFGPSV